jgi:hypothetical protein
VDELRARHCDISEELIEPKILELEEQLAAATERAWQARSEAHDLRQENERLMGTLQKLADVQEEAGATAGSQTGQIA